MAGIVCWNCGASLKEIPRPISRHANCPKCFEALHCCRLCANFDPSVTGQCRDDRTDPPIQKENANFCDFYRPRAGVYRAERGAKSDDARARLDALFAGSEAGEDASDDDISPAPTSKEDEARAKLDALFKDDSDSS